MSILSFYSVIEKYRDFDFESYFNSVTDDDIRRSIHERNLTHEDLLNLLSPKAANHLEEMAEKAAAVGGGKIGLFQSLDKNNILEIYKNAL